MSITAKVHPLAEALFVDLSDEQLKESLGYFYKEVAKLRERKKSDPEILRMKKKLKAYEDEKYDRQIKQYKAKLSAARKMAEARGVQFNLPEGYK